MADTAIEWADRTWNPLLGCERVSPGCTSCYAINTANIRAKNPHPKVAAAFAGLTERRNGRLDWTGRINLLPERMDQPLGWRKPRKIFINSQSDLFHDDVPSEFIAEVFAVMSLTPQHTYQLLTKRHARMRSVLKSGKFWVLVNAARLARGVSVLPGSGPVLLPNLHLGVSVEDQQWADVRIPALLDTPAAVRWLSCEPLLGPIDLTRWIGAVDGCASVSGERGLPSGASRGASGRPSGPDLAHRSQTGRSLGWRNPADSMQATPRRELDGEVFADPDDVQQPTLACDGAPLGMASFSGADPGRLDGQPQERHLVGQPALEPGASDSLGADQAFAGRPTPRTPQPVRDSEPHGEVDLGSGSRDPGAQGGGRAVVDAGNRVRSSVPAHLADRAGRPAISWIVAGGESGQSVVRPMHPQWARSLRDQCVAAGVPFFFKQWGEWGPAPWVVRVCDPEVGWQGTPEELIAAKTQSEAAGATHSYAVWAHRYGHEPCEAGHKPWSSERQDLDETQQASMRRWGKKAAGRLLDGREWNEYPADRVAVA